MVVFKQQQGDLPCATLSNNCVSFPRTTASKERGKKIKALLGGLLRELEHPSSHNTSSPHGPPPIQLWPSQTLLCPSLPPCMLTFSILCPSLALSLLKNIKWYLWTTHLTLPLDEAGGHHKINQRYMVH